MKMTLNNVLSKFVKNKNYHYFHVFADHKDSHFTINNESVLPHVNRISALQKAMNLVNEWKLKGEQNIRVYEVEEWEDYRDGKIEQINENCIYQTGEYPL